MTTPSKVHFAGTCSSASHVFVRSKATEAFGIAWDFPSAANVQKQTPVPVKVLRKPLPVRRVLRT